MEIDPKKAKEYSDRVLQQYQKDPSKLGTHERRLAEKYLAAMAAADRVDNDCRQLNQQIAQAQARVNSLNLQYNDYTGRAAAFLEYLIALKFSEDDVLETKAPEKAPAKRRSKAKP